jgi:hypothetical protein
MLLLMVFYKFLETNGCFTLKMDSSVVTVLLVVFNYKHTGCFMYLSQRIKSGEIIWCTCLR